jgi:hypothetical protein
MLERFERAVERIVEGSIAGVFRLRVQPAEIGRRLERAMLDGRVTSVGTTLAPNQYEVALHPEDAVSFAGWEDALSREMESWLAELAFARGLKTVGPIQVRLVEDASIGRRRVRAVGRYSNPVKPAGPASRIAEDQPPPLRLLPFDPAMSSVTLVGAALSVGRAEDNDLVLPAPEVSRHHARLEPVGKQWRAVDLGSTNGTWINGVRLSSATICSGDELAFGDVRYAIAPG